MANRSNRRRQNPRMTRCEKLEQAIGSWRANSPSWPEIGNPIQHLEAGYTCAVVPHRQRKACLQTEEGSIYGHSRSRIARLCVDLPISPSESKMRASARPPPLDPSSVRASMQIHSPSGFRSKLMVRSEFTKMY